MNIGVVTFFRAPNYGAMLQAYALRRKLETFGHKVAYIDFNFPGLERMPLWRCFFSLKLRNIRIKFDRFLRYSITRFAHRAPRVSDIGKLDVAIVGGDQMWNPMWCTPDYLKQVFLDFVPDECKRISYAVSFSVDEWPHDETRDTVRSLLMKFSGIGVREKRGQCIVRGLACCDSVRVIDPVLLWEPQFYYKMMDSSERLPDKYVFSYLLPWSNSECDYRETLDIVKHILSVPYVITDKHGGVSNFLSNKVGLVRYASVQEWLVRISRASFVLTNSYHGVIFSMLFHRPFAFVPLKGRFVSMNDRIYSILSVFGLNNRVFDGANMNQIVSDAIPWERVDALLDRERLNAMCFFHTVGLN